MSFRLSLVFAAVLALHLLLCLDGVSASVEDLTAAWGAHGYRRCLTLSKTSKKAPLAACTTFQELLEDVLDQQASLMSLAGGVPASQILLLSFDDAFYREFGNEIVDDVLEWLLELRIRDEERIRKRLANQIGSWLLKVAAKDTNMQNVGRADARLAAMF